jgi:hypothetical protein
VGCVQPGDRRVCKLIGSLYGLKQAARAWHFRLTEQLATPGLHPAASEVSLFSGNIPQGWVCVLVYVDDLLLVGVQDAVKSVLDCLSSAFTLSQAGEVSFFLGIQIVRDRGSRTLQISQPRYIHDVLNRFSMLDCNAVSTPVPTGVHLSDSSLAGAKPFAELVGSLLYLANCTRPDIAFGTQLLSRHCANPMQAHWELGKRILRYLKGTMNVRLCYGSDELHLTAYTDSDFAGDLTTAGEEDSEILEGDNECGAMLWE